MGLGRIALVDAGRRALEMSVRVIGVRAGGLRVAAALGGCLVAVLAA
jgi:hypothetical protein